MEKPLPNAQCNRVTLLTIHGPFSTISTLIISQCNFCPISGQDAAKSPLRSKTSKTIPMDKINT